MEQCEKQPRQNPRTLMQKQKLCENCSTATLPTLLSATLSYTQTCNYFFPKDVSAQGSSEDCWRISDTVISTTQPTVICFLGSARSECLWLHPSLVDGQDLYPILLPSFSTSLLCAKGQALLAVHRCGLFLENKVVAIVIPPTWCPPGRCR